MKRCELCGKEFPTKIMVAGKLCNLQRRRYCLECSPFNAHNTGALTEPLTEQSRQTRIAAARRLKYRRYQRKARRQRKQYLVRLLGGCCRICGYDRDCPRAFSFHHRDPALKAFDFARRGLLRHWQELLQEVAKCDLLCLRCHAEVHDGLHPSYEAEAKERDRLLQGQKTEQAEEVKPIKDI